jgi:hypothetical protein
MTNFRLPIFNLRPYQVMPGDGNREFAIEHLSLVIQRFDYWFKIPLIRKEGSTKLGCAPPGQDTPPQLTNGH